MVELAPPVSVSPFIRSCRWGFLAAGIAYGAFNYKRLSRKEAKIREYEAKQMEVLKVKREAEKQKQIREEMITLAKDVGVPVPPNF
uniref:ATP synthase F(0) complex subunit e, mitochondrial n=1 Tax=Amblyomma americanum TaxID=6943 RepID=A0A0C9SBK2_AMBAM